MTHGARGGAQFGTTWESVNRPHTAQHPGDARATDRQQTGERGAETLPLRQHHDTAKSDGHTGNLPGHGTHAIGPFGKHQQRWDHGVKCHDQP